MRKNAVRQIVLHTAVGQHPEALADRMSRFHAEIIERCLRHANLTAAQKIAVLDGILSNLRTREREQHGENLRNRFGPNGAEKDSGSTAG